MVLVSSFPFAINWSEENIPAILHVTNNSQELGNGLADVIFGKFNPAGRTTQTWVKSIDHLPPMMDYDIRNGRTYMYTKYPPLYPFGYGLSYTEFKYSNLSLSNPIFLHNDSLIISLSISIIGDRDGEEVVQLYVSFPNSSVERPIKQLKGFQRVMIRKRESKTVNFVLTSEDLSYWNDKASSYEVEKGKVKIMIGSFSQNIHLKKNIEAK